MGDPRIWLVRHGETAWSATGRHTGRTDVPLTDTGRRAAEALGGLLASHVRGGYGLVLVSPLLRARQTALLAGLDTQVEPDLAEWDYGGWEGRTTAQIRADLDDPGWVVWERPVPPGATPGEQLGDVAERVDRVLDRCERVLVRQQDCMLVAHAHVLRILTARWLGLAPIEGRLFTLAAASLSSLGFERTQHVVRSWNLLP